MSDYCFVVKLQFPEALYVVGIAAESGVHDPDLPDLSHFDSLNWTPKVAEYAKSLKRELGIFTDTRVLLHLIHAPAPPSIFTSSSYPRLSAGYR